MLQPAGNWVDARRSADGSTVLINLAHVKEIEDTPDGSAVLVFADGEKVQLNESSNEFFMRAQGRKKPG
jgi:uncharacterized protein YlzI (FlbEa/FlbD family)